MKKSADTSKRPKKIPNSTIEQQLASSLEAYSKTTLLVGISGGPDSTSLLCALSRLDLNQYHITLRAAHVNYGLRGTESAGDEKFVRSLCKKLQVPLAVHRVKKPKNRTINTQQWARDVRFRFFSGQLQKYPGTVVLAHTADDQAETAFLQLLRGAGISGISSMRQKGFASSFQVPVWRPFLQIQKKELLTYLKDLKQPYRVDRTNLETHYRRNQIRHLIFPYIKRKTGVDASAYFAQLAMQSSDISDLLDEIVRPILQQSVRQPSSISFLRSSLRQVPLLRFPIVFGYFVQAACSTLSSESAVSRPTHTRAFSLFLSGHAGQIVPISTHLRIHLTRTHFIFEGV